MKNQVGSSRMDTVLKMLLIAFVSLLAFSSGVYFGKQMSDSDYQLKALESDFNSHSRTAASERGGHGDETVGEEEVAALSEKFVNSEKDELADNAEKAAAGHAKNASDDHGDGHGQKNDDQRTVASADAHGDDHGEDAGHGTKAAHGAAKVAATGNKTASASHGADHAEDGDDHAQAAPAKPTAAKTAAHQPATAKPDLTAAQKAATRVANNAAPTEPPRAEPVSRVPTSLPRMVGPGQDVEFTVQVASYPTMDIAKEHASELVRKGFPAFPVEATVNGRTWYRVSVGSFKTMKEATTYRGNLLKQAELQSAIVQKIQR